MTAERRKTVLVSVMVVMMAIAAIWNTVWMFDEKSQAKLAGEDLLEVRAMARNIGSLRSRPAVAFAQAIEVRELGGLLDSALRVAGNQGALVSVEPRAARRIGDTLYVHKPTELRLEGLSLNQLVTFLYHLTDDSGLSVRRLHLMRPTQPAPPFVWNAEATVTYLVYSPPDTDRRNK